jgi:hypothetical protein
MAANKTSLSAGLLLRQLLDADEEVKSRVNHIFPVFTSMATLPYILYRRRGLAQLPTKQTQPNDSAEIEILCYTQSYTDGVELAEAVRNALDNRRGDVNGLTMRSCLLTDSEELYQDDAFIQFLVFTVKI